MKQLLRNDWAWLGLFVLLFMVLGPLPPAFGLGAIAGDFGVQVLLTIMIYMIFGLGLNIVIGYTGLLERVGIDERLATRDVVSLFMPLIRKYRHGREATA